MNKANGNLDDAAKNFKWEAKARDKAHRSMMGAQTTTPHLLDGKPYVSTSRNTTSALKSEGRLEPRWSAEKVRGKLRSPNGHLSDNMNYDVWGKNRDLINKTYGSNIKFIK